MPATLQSPDTDYRPDGGLQPGQEYYDQEFNVLIGNNFPEQNLPPEVAMIRMVQMIGHYLNEIRQTQGFETPGTDSPPPGFEVAQGIEQEIR